MKITVSDCLSLDALKHGKLVAGERNIGNRVRSVSVMDAPDVEVALKRNAVREQMVLTSFYGLSDKRKMQSEIIRGLAVEGASALAIFHVVDESLYVGDIQDMADQVGLPLILIPDSSGTEYAEAIEQIMDKLLYGNSFKNSLINNTIYHLLNFEKYKDLSTALREAALNNEFQVVLLSKDFNPVLTVETRQLTTVADAIRLGKERHIEKATDRKSVV